MTQLISDSSPRDGQALLGQRCMTSPSGLTISAPQSGHFFGIRNRLVPFACGSTGPTTWGMTSPARWTMTVSPWRMSLRLMSSSLCSVAWETVTPPTSTGSSCAHGFSAPVRPTRTWIFRSFVCAVIGRPLEGARPARAPVQRAEPLLLVDGVDLDDDAVDLVVELEPLRLPLGALPRDRLERLVALRVRVRAEAALAQPLERLPVRAELEPVGAADAVDPDREVALGGDLRVELAQGAGGGVARVRRRLLALGHEALVQPVEGGQREVDLAAHLEHRRRRIPVDGRACGAGSP